MVNLERGNAAAYDAVKRWDRRSRVGLVQNLVAFTPANPASAADRRGAEHADYIFNRLFLNAALRGRVDRNANGTIEPTEIRSRGKRKADFVGVNYYFRGRVTGLPGLDLPGHPRARLPPQTDYRTPQKPTAPPCPTECSEFGNEIYPEGLRTVLGVAGRYGLPVIITENGLADADDNQRPSHLVRHLRVLRQAMTRPRGARAGLHALVAVRQLRVVGGLLPALRPVPHRLAGKPACAAERRRLRAHREAQPGPLTALAGLGGHRPDGHEIGHEHDRDEHGRDARRGAAAPAVAAAGPAKREPTDDQRDDQEQRRSRRR